MKVNMWRCPCCKKWSILFRNRNKEGPRSSFKHYYVRCPSHGDLFLIAKGKGKPHWLVLGQKEIEMVVEE